MTQNDIIRRAHGYTLELWDKEFRRVEDLQRAGKSSLIAEHREAKLWEELKELESMLNP